MHFIELSILSSIKPGKVNVKTMKGSDMSKFLFGLLSVSLVASTIEAGDGIKASENSSIDGAYDLVGFECEFGKFDTTGGVKAFQAYYDKLKQSSAQPFLKIKDGQFIVRDSVDAWNWNAGDESGDPYIYEKVSRFRIHRGNRLEINQIGARCIEGTSVEQCEKICRSVFEKPGDVDPSLCKKLAQNGALPRDAWDDGRMTRSSSDGLSSFNQVRRIGDQVTLFMQDENRDPLCRSEFDVEWTDHSDGSSGRSDILHNRLILRLKKKTN